MSPSINIANDQITLFSFIKSFGIIFSAIYTNYGGEENAQKIE